MKNKIDTWSLLGMNFFRNAWPTATDACDVNKFKTLTGTSLSHNLTLYGRSSTLNKFNVFNVLYNLSPSTNI